MDCASCVAKLERAVERLPGVGTVQVNLMAERLTITGASAALVPEAVERQVTALGFHPTRLLAAPVTVPGIAGEEGACRPDCGCGHDHGHRHDHAHHHHDHDHHGHAHRDAAAVHTHAHAAAAGEAMPAMDAPWWRSGKAGLVAVLGGLIAVAWGLAQVFPDAAYWVYLVATLVALFPFGRRALRLARAGSPFSIEMLMSLAALGAVAIGAAGEAAVVVLLFALGELLESVAAGRARAGIRALGALIPRTARRETLDGGIAEVPAASLRVGDVVQVRPGDRLPCDGEILEGRSALDESPVTGESVPVARGPGDPVIAGSINAEGVLRVRVTRAAADNTVARIIRLVEEAAAARAPTQRFIERFARIWTPAALGASLLVMLVPPLLLDGDWWGWAYRGLALLLIACPCALVISVPAALASGLSAGARRGLLVKGGAALETIGAARHVAFDKTGTLTAGTPRVTEVVPLQPGVDAAGVLAFAAAAEAGSSHPLARAITAAASGQHLEVPPATQARAVPGLAVEALVAGRRILVGSPRAAAEAGAGLDAVAPRIAALQEAGNTVAVVLADGAPFGLVAMRDEPRADAASGVAALQALGVGALMLTGDNSRTGQAIAARLGLAVRAELLPGDKLREIAALRAEGVVVMVGDGINDAPALAAASVGVAMGGGTDVALETADAALLRERVVGVAELVALSRATLATIRQNVALALGLKAAFLVTTVAGITGLWPAILADTGATVLVTLNALRLLRWRPSLPHQPRPVTVPA
ncbi:cadmium-translocating P-type ATPase [Rhodovastum atsumiense]|uniref:P-type Zn(2+) transporter n=2 Tax=Rhodovastum atsumiense TaxID=504468 RepID=A0A5M6IXA7_9PROT|nr:cadmium-translocating P-type ATPase [Rhodovastum atsumiense]